MLKAAYLQSEDWSFAAFLHKIRKILQNKKIGLEKILVKKHRGIEKFINKPKLYISITLVYC